MAEGRALAGPAQVHQARFDGDPTSIVRLLMRTEARGNMAATEAGAGLLDCLPDLPTTSLVGLSQHLVDEGLSALLRFPRFGAKALTAFCKTGKPHRRISVNP
ncbi:hypothetical protein PCA10_35450 [Metapseudomonas resinovorans NBRC 106553]|uniref:Uncharacterized protein n=1 Tax=Metapseudomonas resinovorans NBRC 106553 TaxID=1245471 RepID=S6AGA4_METRE|nr:hypothetical protein PCA10_35450 [Pseudomonas resinovorans NBRC 106553]